MEQKKLSVSDLNNLFSESKTQLQEHMADARTNNNLYQGNHFKKTQQERVSRGVEKLTDDNQTKIRVTKNHTNTICKYIINSILSLAPTGVIMPKNPGEIQDQKAAEIHSAVLEDWKIKTKFKKQVRNWAHDFVVSGEVFIHPYWDPTKGKKIGEEQILDQATGQPTGVKPIFEGDVVCERWFSWDVRQDPGAKTFEEAKWVGHEGMVSADEIKKTFGNTEQIEKACKSDMDETFKVFDSTSTTYKEAKGMVLLRRIFYRPCVTYPTGYFVYFTKDLILAEGSLPADNNGRCFFPVLYLGFDEVPTSARSASLIKQIRPDQMEINRCASAIALTQMTLGFDKMIAPAGGEITSGGFKGGVSIIKVPGGKANADIIPGRSGDQFLGYMNAIIAEMYNKVGVPETFQEKQNDVDIMASLYKNMRQKTRFSLYGEKFSEFLVEAIEEVLRLKKAYMLDDTYVLAVGKNEQVNIAEFRNAADLGYQIKVEQGTEDLESQFGRHMSLTSIMQYLGQGLDNNTIGMIIKNLPFSNKEEISSKFTMDYDNARNIMLALDRGEIPEVTQIENPQYISQELNHRMRKPDFKFLPTPIQINYQQQVAAYNELYNANVRQVQMAAQGLIPFDGPTVPVDGMYETVMGSNGQAKTTRLQIPQSALMWLSEKLKQQGAAMGDIQSLPLGQQAQVAQQYLAGSPSSYATKDYVGSPTPTPAGTPSGASNGGFPVS